MERFQVVQVQLEPEQVHKLFDLESYHVVPVQWKVYQVLDFEMFQEVQVLLEPEIFKELFYVERFQVVPNLLHLSPLITHSPQIDLHNYMINLYYISQNSP